MSDLSAKKLSNVELSAHALADLEEIWLHYSEKSETAARKVLKEITGKFSKLQEFPKLGKERNDFLIGLRSFPAGKFLIFIRKPTRALKLSVLFTVHAIFRRFLKK